ncbi:MAG TPA: GEVED domain-containing protein [Bacteroidia bacterium]|nr:T9SS type A sorting domain-containing protein [Bacteroidia bacterium]MBP7713856.1 T9SS type A sorting domain-containing protein [Bacteroidia bacterium]MBP8668192.1 T9SS type A sorting domain-containing protein [Bacteroidia bacterium]HOZ81837.1 GEVED domain-containing protein [Bacteroidia bacterium]HOZ90761.1 GEVED domain-containing protein [Bacteroidia bacterium]
MKKIKLIIILLLVSNMLQSQTIVLQETFDGQVMPTGWHEDSAGFAPVINQWNFIYYPFTMNGIGFDASFIRTGIANHDYSLVSPSFSTVGLSDVYLSYSDYHQGPIDSGYQNVEMSVDSGQSWTIMLSNNGYNHYLGQNGSRRVVHLGTNAANQPNVKIRFHFKVGGGWRWAIDSVVVNDYQLCTTPTDSTGVVYSSKDFLCSGIAGFFWIDHVSGGIGQTYQWQYKPWGSSSYLNIAGAVYDTMTFVQNTPNYYRCLVVCNADTAGSMVTFVTDSPTVVPKLRATNFSGICPGSPDTTYIFCEKNIPGIGYQWQWKQNIADPFTDIAGANDTLYAIDAAVFPNQIYLRCKQQCIQSGKYLATATEVIFENPNPSCYCIPYNQNYCGPSTPIFDGGIVDMHIAGTTLNNPSSTCSNIYGYPGQLSNYTYFDPTVANQTATLSRNVPYSMTITTDTLQIWFKGGLWIDYDHDSYFENTEYTTIDSLYPGTPRTITFSIPATATPGLTGMRLRVAGNFPSVLNANSACTYAYGGETEDYMITIDTIVGIGEVKQHEANVQLYPVPASGYIVVQSSQTIRSVRLESTTGALVKQDNGLNTNNWRMDVSSYAPGMYLMRTETSAGVVMKKVMISRE